MLTGNLDVYKELTEGYLDVLNNDRWVGLINTICIGMVLRFIFRMTMRDGRFKLLFNYIIIIAEDESMTLVFNQSDESPESGISKERTHSSLQEFAALVHDALNNLYDSPQLEFHQLGFLLIAPEKYPNRRAQELRRILLAAIRSMRPEPNTPQKSRDWRAYRILESRYISGLNPAEVMTQLALSRSTFFNEQARVLDSLVDILWKQRVRLPGNNRKLPFEEVLDGEVNRLLEHVIWETVDAVSLINEMMPVLVPLVEIKAAHIEINLRQTLTIWKADRVLLRQILFTVITKGMGAAFGGSVSISTYSSGAIAGIAIQVESPSDTTIQENIEPQHGLSIETCQHLLEKMMGKIVYKVASPQQLEIRLEWSTVTSKSLLVIDDNVNMADLVARYLGKEDWRVFSAANGIEARRHLSEFSPTIILLDVILPQEDGWELLLALKMDEKTRHIPVIVCSAINEPKLATSLGAISYLPKPVTQQALLHVLESLIRTGASSEPAR